jgi:hypothetical protein
MKAVSIKDLKEELANCTPKEVRDLCLRLARFKKENKELLTYILFESSDEGLYVDGVKQDVDDQFKLINRKTNYLIKKGLRKILRTVRKYARYSQKKETEVELLVYFCTKLNKFSPSIHRNTGLQNIYNRQIEAIIKKTSLLHEDLQVDYKLELDKLDNTTELNYK